MKTVMIVAGESSGELYGSLLARELTKIWPEISIVGIGGERMRDAGVEMISDISSAFGITELLSSLKRLRTSFSSAVRMLDERTPDVVVLIDFPDFNFRLAKRAKERGLKVLYYVSPHVWAWRKGRARTIKEIADRIAVILPFEEAIYRRAGVPCEFVGHPIIEEIEAYEALNPDSRAWIDREDADMKNPTLALLPGSRPHELGTLFPVFVELVKLFMGEFPRARVVLPLAPNIDTKRFGQHLKKLGDLGVKVLKGDAVRALAESDIAVIASGTATLQAALLGRPLVVVYKLSTLSYLLARVLLKVKYISLVNLIPGTMVVPELIQHQATPGNVMAELKKIVHDDDYRARMITSFRELRKEFSGRRPSQRVAEMAGELAGWSRNA